MKITFILPELTLNGGIRVVFEYTRELISLGHEVNLIAKKPRSPRIIDIIRGRQKFDFNSKKLPEFCRALENNIKLTSSRKALSHSDLPNADFLVSTWWETVEWTKNFPKEKGLPVHLMQGYEMFPWLSRERVSNAYEQNNIKISVSEWVAKKVEENHGRISSAVIHNAVDTEKFVYVENRNNDITRVGFIYSKPLFKNSKLILEISEILKRRNFPFELKTFHSDNMDREFSSLLEVNENYRPSQKDIVSIYQSCDLWIFPSLEEGFGLPILEAFSCGTPVIATHAGAAPQLIQNEINGYLRNPDPHAFADAIMLHASLEESKKTDMGRAARESAESWTWNDAASKFVDTLNKVDGGYI